MRKYELCAVLVLSLVPLAILGQEHPNSIQGLRSDQTYLSSEIDSVNLFNGSLTISIPIGHSYPLREGFSYQFYLTYTSDVWDAEWNSAQQSLWSIHKKTSNAGLGWRFHLGRLLVPSSAVNDSNWWVYEGANGSTHNFNHNKLHWNKGSVTSGLFYTRDGSYLRLDTRGPNSTVEFPNGEIHTFNSDGWLTKMEDRFGNHVTVNMSNPNYWDISDNHGRSHRVNLIAFDRYDDYQAHVDSVVLDAFGSASATYDFVYAEHGVRVAPSQIGKGFDCGDGPAGCTPLLPLLTELKLPDYSTNGGYSMPLSDYHLPTGGDPSWENGTLQAITLPTTGRIEWDYEVLSFPDETACNALQGGSFPAEFSKVNLAVNQRRLVQSNGNNLGITNYDHIRDGAKKTTKVWNSDTPNHTTDHYFSATTSSSGYGLCASVPGDWSEPTYGLPFDPLDLSTAKLSRRVYVNGTDINRTTRVIYDYEEKYENNARLRYEKTIFNDDSNSSIVDSYDDFDGVGHYRSLVQSSSSHFGFGDGRTTFTDYNHDLGPFDSSWQPPSDWLLSTFDYQTVTEGTDTSRIDYCFDSSTGFLRRTRKQVGNSANGSVNDVVTVFGGPVGGNPTFEAVYGGDTHPVGVGSNVCNVSTSGYARRINFGYQYGVRKSTEDHGSTYRVEHIIDQSTGLIERTTNPDTTHVVFDYDKLGRLTKEQPSEDRWVKNTYFRSGPTRIKTIYSLNGSHSTTADLANTIFDDLGRFKYLRRKHPNHSSLTMENQVFYDKNGRVERVNVDRWTSDPIYSTNYLNFDPFGRPGKIKLPDNEETTFTYKGIREVIRKVDVVTGWSQGSPVVEEAQTIETYDRYGRLRSVQDPTTTATYDYDEANNLISVEVGGSQGQERQFHYDNRGFLLYEKHPEKGLTGGGYVVYARHRPTGKYELKADGCSVANYYASGCNGTHKTEWIYDSRDRLVEVRDDVTNDVLKEFLYNDTENQESTGKLISQTQTNYLVVPFNPTTTIPMPVTENFSYLGSGGRIDKRETIIEQNPPIQWDTYWSYDDFGNVTSLTYPECVAGFCAGMSDTRIVTNTYKWSRFLTSVSGHTSGSISYYPNGLVNNIPHSNGLSQQFSRDAHQMNRPGELVVGALSIPYEYDGAGNVTKFGEDEFSYDRSSRVVRHQGYDKNGNPLFFQSYGYDAYGNFTSVTTQRPGEVAGLTRSVWVSTTTNRLSAEEFDRAGNQKTAGVSLQHFNWSPLNQLETVNADPNKPYELSYVYGADDERLWIYDCNGDCSNKDITIHNYRLRDLDGRLLRTYRLDGRTDATPPNVTWVRDYVYRGSSLLGSYSAGSEGRRHFYLDHVGTPMLTKSATGSHVAFEPYFPYGELLNNGGAPATSEVVRFTGHERDFLPAGGNDDMDYMHARYCSPMMGRFFSTDPINSGKVGAPGSWNKYTYALNNPVKYVDPDGRAVETAWDVANVAIGAGSFIANVSAGNVLGAVVDAGGLALDLGATAVPFVPGGASASIKASRLAANARFGKAFENAVLGALDLSKNTSRVDSVTGTAKFRVPDAFSHGVLVEVKGVKKLRLTNQVKDFLGSAAKEGRKVVIAVTENTKIDKKFRELVESGEVFIVRFAPE